MGLLQWGIRDNGLDGVLAFRSRSQQRAYTMARPGQALCPAIVFGRKPSSVKICRHSLLSAAYAVTKAFGSHMSLLHQAP